MCNLQIIHGIIKYLGSTSGAVMSESAVLRMKIRRNDVVGPSGCSFTILALDSLSLLSSMISLVVFLSWKAVWD